MSEGGERNQAAEHLDQSSPHELYLVYLGCLVAYLEHPTKERKARVLAAAAAADRAVHGYWSRGGDLSKDLELRLCNLVGGNPVEWDLLIRSVAGEEPCHSQLVQLAPPAESRADQSRYRGSFWEQMFGYNT